MFKLNSNLLSPWKYCKFVSEHSETGTHPVMKSSTYSNVMFCLDMFLFFVSSSALIDTSNWEFPDVCKYYFGSFGQWSSLLFSMVSLVGAMIVYWVLMSNFLFNTGKFIYSKYTFFITFYICLVEKSRLCFILKKDRPFYLILIFLLLHVRSQMREVLVWSYMPSRMFSKPVSQSLQVWF